MINRMLIHLSILIYESMNLHPAFGRLCIVSLGKLVTLRGDTSAWNHGECTGESSPNGPTFQLSEMGMALWVKIGYPDH